MKFKFVTALSTAAVVIGGLGMAFGAGGTKVPPVDVNASSSSAVIAAAPAGVSATTSPAPATGTKTATITDPILKMPAYTLTIPSDWIFDGAVGQGTPCVPGAFPIWRMSSPDGLTGFKALPVLAWAWWDKPTTPAQAAAVQGCMDYKQNMAATDVLKYMIGVLQVQFVKFEPVPWLANAQKAAAAASNATSTSTTDIAIATVSYHINNIQIEEQVKAITGCLAFHGGIFNGKHYCTATVSREWAPSGKWNAATFTPIDHSFQINQAWSRQWNATMVQKIKDLYAANGKILQDQMNSANAQLAAQANSFQQSQDMRQKQHDDFDAVLKRGTDMSMQQARASANANHQSAGDWADYSLDQQKRLDPNTGKITKDSSAFSYTWVSDQGKRIQTNDVNTNPNGGGTGNWTLQQNVR